MGRTQIEFDLMDCKSISSAINQLKAYKDLIIQENKQLVKEVANAGVYIAKNELNVVNAVDSGNLRDSIKSEQVYDSERLQIWEVNTDVDYAGFVEYGTGVVGSWNPHPIPKSVTSGGKVYSGYDSQGHGYKGWIYKKNGRTYWTLGYYSRPFMWNTARKLVKRTLSIAKRNYK